MRYRLLDTGIKDASENIALDDVLLRGRAIGKSPCTIRLFKSKPCVLIGNQQALEHEVRVMYCDTKGIATNRRISGGYAVYLDKSQFIWEVVSDLSQFPGEALYKRLCQGACKGLKKLGLDAHFRAKNEIEVRGRKVSETFCAIEGGAFLFQGTLLTDFDAECMLKSLRLPIEKMSEGELESVKERFTCMRWELGCLPDDEEIKRALVEGFYESFGIECNEGKLSAWEKKELAEKGAYFSSKEWIHGIQASRGVLGRLKKKNTGLVRAQLIADIPAKRIMYALITGDLSGGEKRAIFDLEAILRDHPLSLAEIRKTVISSLTNSKAKFEGISNRQLADAIVEAARKAGLTRLGFSPEDSSHIYTMSKSYEHIDHPTVLLLPYCAKLPECKYRIKQGCKRCGGCTAGNAYGLARAHGLVPMTILNYSDLKRKLEKLKKRSEQFIMCCCEMFHAIHEEELNEIGVPGIIIDIEDLTCFELGKAKEAGLGAFNGQTKLRLDILEKVLSDRALKEIASSARRASSRRRY